MIKKIIVLTFVVLAGFLVYKRKEIRRFIKKRQLQNKAKTNSDDNAGNIFSGKINEINLQTIIDWLLTEKGRYSEPDSLSKAFVLKYSEDESNNRDSWEYFRNKSFTLDSNTLLVGFLDPTDNILTAGPLALYNADMISEELLHQFNDNNLIIIN